MDEYKIVKFEQNGVVLDIKINPIDKNVWLSLGELSILFEKSKSVISRHIKNIFKDGELNDAQTVAKNATVQLEGSKKVTRQITYYNIDVAISIGHRVKSQNGLLLKEFINNYFYRNSKKEDNSIIIYNNGNVSLPVTISPKEETVWLGKDDLVLLFDTTRQNVEYHIESIYKQCELEVGATCKVFLQVQLVVDSKNNMNISK